MILGTLHMWQSVMDNSPKCTLVFIFYIIPQFRKVMKIFFVQISVIDYLLFKNCLFPCILTFNTTWLPFLRVV